MFVAVLRASTAASYRNMPMSNYLASPNAVDGWEVASVTLETVNEQGVLNAMEVPCSRLDYECPLGGAAHANNDNLVILKDVPDHIIQTLRFVPTRIRFAAKFLLRTYVLQVRGSCRIADGTIALQRAPKRVGA